MNTDQTDAGCVAKSEQNNKTSNNPISKNNPNSNLKSNTIPYYIFHTSFLKKGMRGISSAVLFRFA